MDRVKKYDKYTVLSELNRLIGNNAPIKGTYVKTLKHDDIFETNVNKTTELHAIKSGNKRVYVPIVKEEPVQEGSISERQLLKLLQNVKNPSAQRILREYLAQNKDIDKEIMNDRIISRTVQATQQKKKQMNDEDKEILKMIIGEHKPTPDLLEFIEGKYEGNEMSELIERIKRARREGNSDDFAYYKRKAQDLTGHFANRKDAKKQSKPLLALTYRGEDKPKPKAVPQDEDTDGDEHDRAQQMEDTVIIEDAVLIPAEVSERRDEFIKKIKELQQKFKSVTQYDAYLAKHNVNGLKTDLIDCGLKRLSVGLTTILGNIKANVEKREKAINAQKYKAQHQ